MRMMGADSVDYHRATVMERGDDHPGQALDYYASRGETPLMWGGSGAEALGLSGAVTHEAYEAIYGAGGAVDPTTGTRLVRTTRPGMELVISAHKSVAELGVLGRTEDMHRIMDAERNATMSYLDDVTRKAGGRRGQAATPSPTRGLVFAHSRHATSRAGDPNPHDHVLLANVIEMADERGGHKAPDTTTWREHLHAATMVGRMAAARVSTELGYGIEADPGPSGRLGHWRIAGIPDAVLEVHSKRAAEIEAEVRTNGFDSYRARNVAARTTRRAKRHEPEGHLVARWREELHQAGYPLPELDASLERARRARTPVESLDVNRVRELVDEALAAEGALGSRKVFARRDVIVALAPHLYGQDPAVLERMVDRALADPEAIPLVGVRGVKERVWSTATTLATEQAIGDTVAGQMARSDAPAIAAGDAVAAVRAAENRGGYQLTAAQEDAVVAICTSGRGAEMVLGVAGSGKTTMLSVAREAFEASGYEVLGTATSGQAARNLGREAGISESRTLASLAWRLDHRRITLSERSVVVLDEVGMTGDPDLVRLLAHVEATRAKVVLVGDHRQLGAVGPGGALEALVNRHRDQVQVLYENLRQTDPEEARALGALRAGDVDAAVSWYRRQERIVTGRSRDEAMDRAVEAWADDVLGDKDAALYAWRRANVDELNKRARARMAEAGRLYGPELVAPGGRAYRAGDRVVTLAPDAGGAVVTSERAVVEHVDVEHNGVVLRTEDRRRVGLAGEEISAERLAHAYAVTAHRSQGQTVGQAHVYADGGGRELAYVAMSRAREASHAYLVADSVDQAAEDLRREWSSERRMGWASDLGVPDTQPQAEVHENDRLAALAREAKRLADRAAGKHEAEKARRAALDHARLQAIYDARTAAVPKSPALEIAAANGRLRDLRDLQGDLQRGVGVWADTEAGRAARDVIEARREMRWASSRAEQAGWRHRRSYRNQEAAWSGREAEALGRWYRHGAPEVRRLDGQIAEGERAVEELGKGYERLEGVLDRFQLDRTRSRLSDFGKDIYALRDRLDRMESPSLFRDQAEGSVLRPPRALDHDHGLSHEPYRGIDRDIGRGLGR
jgi:conjugative relaxase-like TrwC/TraI family protein